jgi:hypothetical protein
VVRLEQQAPCIPALWIGIGAHGATNNAFDSRQTQAKAVRAACAIMAERVERCAQVNLTNGEVRSLIPDKRNATLLMRAL